MATVLTIDRDTFHLEAVASLLEAQGHAMLAASDPARALLLLGEAVVDLVIIEPATQPDGLALCRQIRDLNPYRPLMILSARVDDDDIFRGLMAGADDYLGKHTTSRLFVARVHAVLRRAGDRMTHADRQFGAMRRMLDAAWEIPFKPAIRTPFPDLAKALGTSLGATYCRLAVREGRNRLRVRASAGHRRPSLNAENRTWSLAAQSHANRALREWRSAPLDFAGPDQSRSAEREPLFTQTTRRGVLIPFRSDRIDGLLVIGEERQSRGEPFTGEHLATLEHIANRVGDILRMTDLMRRERIAERQRQLEAVKRVERARLARELHDEVGQSLSGLLIRLRLARSEGSITVADIDALERATQDALDAARSVAYDLRRRSGATDAFQEARDFAETVLGAAGCQLIWTDRRGEAPLDSRTAHTAARVIKESVTNVVRHSNARCTEISIEEADRRLRVTIRDDGQGFAPAADLINRDGRGLGLLGNRERLSQLGGTFQVTSAPGSGTSVTLELPWRRRAPAVARAG